MADNEIVAAFALIQADSLFACSLLILKYLAFILDSFYPG